MKLDPILRQIKDEVTIDTVALSGSVRGRELEAKSLRELDQQLQAALYEAYHARPDSVASPDTPPRPGRDFDLERELVATTEGLSSKYPLEVGDDGVFRFEGIRVTLSEEQRTRLTTADGQTFLTDRAVRPALSPGFVLVRSAGADRGWQEGLLRLYLGIADPAGARIIWEKTLRLLGGFDSWWQTKVLSRSWDYPRTDAQVVYLPVRASRHLPQFLKELESLPQIGGNGSRFAHAIRDGIALAFEPSDLRDGYAGDSFGQHRSKVISHWLIESGPSDEEALMSSLILADIDPANIARNLSSLPLAGLGLAE